MFKRKQRIRASEISQMFKENTKSEKTELFFFKIKNNNLGFPRFAIIVPKKVYKTAVARHQVKRLLVRNIKELLPADNKIEKDFIITVSTNLDDVTNNQIQSEFAKIIN
jgi:ribonuclease P protein component